MQRWRRPEQDAPRRRRRTLVLTGVRRRPVAFIGLMLLTAGAVVVSVCAPLLLRAAQQASLGAAAWPSTPAVRMIFDGSVKVTPELGQGLLLPETLWRTSSPVITSLAAAPWAAEGSSRRFRGHLVTTFDCTTGVVLSAGRCPEEVGQVAVPADSDAQVGDRIALLSEGSSTFEVVGRDRQSAVGGPFTDLAVANALRVVDPVFRGDDLLVPDGTVQGRPNGFVTVVPVSLRHPMRLEEVAEVRSSIRDARRTLAQTAGGVLSAPILDVIDEQEAIAAAATLIALSLAAQTLAVAWAAQALLVGAIARSRAGEWGVARLRGFPRRRRVLAAFAEPALAVGAGAVLGAVAAVLLAQAILTATVGGLVQPLQPLPIAVAVLAVLGCLVALVLASVRAATVPLVQLLRERTEPRRIGRLALIAQSGVVLATVLVLYSVITGGVVSGPQLPIAAPALIALTIGLLALRVALPLLRRRLRGAPRSLFGLVVGRRVVRTPSLLATAVVVCVAVALATAALQTAIVSSRLQHARAEATVGAQRVLDVGVPRGVDLVTAVRRADPSGRLAMAAEDLVDGSGLQRVVAVDTARLAAVSTWKSGWSGTSAAALRRELAPTPGPSVRLEGARVTLGIADARIVELAEGGGLGLVTLHDLELVLRVQSPTGFRSVDLGRLDADRFTASIPCQDGCRVVDLRVEDRGFVNPWAVQIDIASIATDRQAAEALAGALEPDRWRLQVDTSVSLTPPPSASLEPADPSGLRVVLKTFEGSAATGIAPRDSPARLPILLGPELRVDRVPGMPGAVLGSGLALETLLAHPVGRALILPRALASGVLVDLSTVRRVSDPAADQAQPQVWLSAAAGPSTVRALRDAGLRIRSEQRLPVVEAGYLGQTVPLVTWQGAGVGLIGLLLAAMVVLVAQLLRRPATIATAQVLRASGADPGRIRRLAILEAALPAGAGALLGAVAGALGAAAVLHSLPLGAGAGFLPPVDYTVSPLAALLPLGCTLVTIAVVAVATTGGRRSR